MAYTCKECKHGHDRSPDNRRIPQGTVWCGLRKIAMAQKRTLSCFVPLVTEKSKRCQDCKHARLRVPTGENAQLGNVWCVRRHIEINKLRTMECFE